MLFFLLILALIAANAVYTYPRITRAYRIAHNGHVYTGRYLIGSPKNKNFRLLVLGDSGITGQEVPTFTDSAGGRLACMLAQQHYVEYLNQAGMGKWVGDIEHEQISGQWDLAVLALGSNDLLHDGDFKIFKRNLNKLMAKLSEHATTIIVAGPGEISKSKIFPWWYRIILYSRQRRYAATINKAVTKVGGYYFNPLTEPQIFEHMAKDGLHLGVKGNHLFANALWRTWLTSQSSEPQEIHSESIESVVVKENA